MTHKYSLDEIDRMRAALKRRSGEPNVVIYTSAFGPSHVTPESEAALHKWKTETEDQLRTCMLGGVRPEELEAKHPPPKFGDER